MEEWLLNSHLPTVQDGSAQEPLHNVFFLVVTWQHVFVNRKCAGPHVVGDPTHATAVIVPRHIRLVAHLSHSFNEWPQNIDVEVAVDALQHRAGAFEAHACVDVAAREWAQIVG